MAKDGYLEADRWRNVFDNAARQRPGLPVRRQQLAAGQAAAAFDLLVWNGDSTRMPAKMHSQYLRSCYLNNEFARGEFVIGGTKLDPKKVTVDTYVVSAVNDHIVPWASGYKTPRCSRARTSSC